MERIKDDKKMKNNVRKLKYFCQDYCKYKYGTKDFKWDKMEQLAGVEWDEEVEETPGQDDDVEDVEPSGVDQSRITDACKWYNFQPITSSDHSFPLNSLDPSKRQRAVSLETSTHFNLC